MKTKTLLLSSLMLSGLLLTSFSKKAFSNDSDVSSDLSQKNQVITVAQNQNDDVLTEAELNAEIARFAESKNCNISEEPSQKTKGDLTILLYNCVGFNFEVIDPQSPQPATGLTVKRHPILALQKGNQYKVRFKEAKAAAPRIIIKFTEDGSAEFGDKYPPLTRAEIITEKFNQHYIDNGDVEKPPLSKGIVNGKAVVCAAPLGGCNSENVLWTLKSANRRSDIINDLNSALKGEASTFILESEDNIEDIPEVNMTKYMEKYKTEATEQLENESSDKELTSELANSKNWDNFSGENSVEQENATNQNRWQEAPDQGNGLIELDNMN